MKADIQAIFAEASANVPKPAAEYLGNDGLLHCETCNEPVQCRITVFEKIITVRCICRCIQADIKAAENRAKQAEHERAREDCFEGAKMQSWTFAEDDLKQERLSRAMQRYAAQFGDFMRTGKGLLLYGGNGTGKTFYASCIANALIDSGYKCLVTSFARLEKKLQSVVKKQEYIEGLSMFDLIVFDDLGAERQSEYMQEQVFSIVNARYCSGLPFIVTTNLTIDEIAKPQDAGRARIYSRILERCYPLEVVGADRRKTICKTDYADMGAKLGLYG